MYKSIMHSVMCRYSIYMYTLAHVKYIFWLMLHLWQNGLACSAIKHDRIQKLCICGNTVNQSEKEEWHLIDKSDWAKVVITWKCWVRTSGVRYDTAYNLHCVVVTKHTQWGSRHRPLCTDKQHCAYIHTDTTVQWEAFMGANFQILWIHCYLKKLLLVKPRGSQSMVILVITIAAV